MEILNGTTVTGLAGRTRDLLEDFGYHVVFVGNADRNDHERTLIIDQSGHRERAMIFGDLIRSRNIRFDVPYQADPETGSGFQNNFMHRSDFILILGRDFNGRYVID